MFIQKILNNNVVITKNEADEEVIVTGKGIAFQKRVGDFVPKEKIDKTYHLIHRQTSLQFQELLKHLPIEYLTISTEIIDDAKKQLETELNDSIYISLTDHIHMAIERMKKGIAVKNSLLWDMKRFFAAEYHIGVKALEKVQELYQITLPEDEAGFIALHLVNAQKIGKYKGNMHLLTKVLQEIMTIIQYYFHLTVDEESVYFYRFTTHMKFFLYRLQTEKQIAAQTDEELLAMIKAKYRNEYRCTEKIIRFLNETYQYQVSEDEKIYLTIHIARLVAVNK